MIANIYPLALIFISLAILIVSADQLVSQADSLAQKFNFSQILIGLTVVAFGTSAPELIVSISAAILEVPATNAIVGNVIGSNIANSLLVLGTAGLLYKVDFNNIDRITNFYLFIVTACVILILSTESNINYLHSIIFLIILIFFIQHLSSFKNDDSGTTEIDKKVSYLRLLLSFIGFFIGGNLFLSESLTFFSNLGIGHTVIGLAVLALGTSLPELITLIISALRKKTAIGIGNIIGSNIMNILFVLLPSVLIVQSRGIEFSLSNLDGNNDLALLAIVTSIIITLSLIKKPLNKVLSLFFILSYIIFIYKLF